MGLKQRYLKLFFVSVADLMKVRKDILPAVRKNKEREKSSSIYGGILKETYFEAGTGPEREKASSSSLDNIIDIRYTHESVELNFKCTYNSTSGNTMFRII